MNRYFVKILFVVVLIAGCAGPRQTSKSIYREDVLYYENTDAGRRRAQEVLDIFKGRQKVAIVDKQLPPVKNPVPIVRFAPYYPPGLRDRGITGKVLVQFIVDENGDVIDAVAVEGSRPELNSIAEAAVRRWKFKPAEREGAATRTILENRMEFAIE